MVVVGAAVVDGTDALVALPLLPLGALPLFTAGLLLAEMFDAEPDEPEPEFPEPPDATAIIPMTTTPAPIPIHRFRWPFFGTLSFAAVRAGGWPRRDDVVPACHGFDPCGAGPLGGNMPGCPPHGAACWTVGGGTAANCAR